MSHPRGTFYVANSILSPWPFDGKWHKKGESEGITTPPQLDGDTSLQGTWIPCLVRISSTMRGPANLTGSRIRTGDGG